MLHFCSGLQHVQDLEETEKDEILIRSTCEFTDTDLELETTEGATDSISISDETLDIQ